MTANACSQECFHAQTTINEQKIFCVNCGLVEDKYGNPYIRSISHYKQLYKDEKAPPINVLLGEELQNKATKFQIRQIPKSKGYFQTKPLCVEEHKQIQKIYNEYVLFLRNNEDRILPQKNRQRPICQVYGEHRKFLLQYISLLLSKVSPP